MSPKKKLGELLINAGLIDAVQLQSALGHQKQWGMKLGTSLIEMGFVKEETLADFLSNQMRAPGINLSEVEISEEVFTYIPKDIAEKYMVVPVELKEGPGKKTLVVAIADPTNLGVVDDLQFSTGCKIDPRVTPESAILKVLKNYGKRKEKEEKAIELGEEFSETEALPSGSEEMEIVRDVIEQTAAAQQEQIKSVSVKGETKRVKTQEKPVAPEIAKETELKDEEELPLIEPEADDTEAFVAAMAEVQKEVQTGIQEEVREEVQEKIEAIREEPPEEAPAEEIKPPTEQAPPPQPLAEKEDLPGPGAMEEKVSAPEFRAADWESIIEVMKKLDSLRKEVMKTKSGLQSILSILIKKGQFSKEEFLEEMKKRKTDSRTKADKNED